MKSLGTIGFIPTGKRNEYKCPWCEYASTDSHNLIEHAEQKHTDVLFDLQTAQIRIYHPVDTDKGFDAELEDKLTSNHTCLTSIDPALARELSIILGQYADSFEFDYCDSDPPIDSFSACPVCRTRMKTLTLFSSKCPHCGFEREDEY